MGLESSFNFIDDLDSTNPASGDNPSQGDDHLRGIKSAIQGSFTSLGSAAVTATAAELNVLDGITKTTAELNASSFITQMTPQATTSGTTVDFTGINGAKRITVILDNVSSTAIDSFLVTIGDSGGVEVTGYEGSRTIITTTVSTAGATTGFLIGSSNPSTQGMSGIVTLVNITGNIWAATGTTSYDSDSRIVISSGIKTLSGTLDRVRLQTSFGSFDAGQVNVVYEG